MISTPDILSWLEINGVWLWPRRRGEFDDTTNPTIPRPYDEQTDWDSLPIFVRTGVYEHQGHPRQKFPCYLEFMAILADGPLWSKADRLLKEVITAYPDAEYTLGGFHRVHLHFNREDSINLILQLGL